MGNCMDRGKCKEEMKSSMEIIGGKEVKFEKDSLNGVRVKMVLTKEELQLLMAQLSNRFESGAKRVEDVFAEIDKARKRLVADHGWKPSLDSITELPEVLELHR